jgi:antitoxin CptB
MDFILGRFAEARLGDMTGQALSDFEHLLTMPDPVLTQWFSQDAVPEEEAFAALILDLRAFHGLAAAAAKE